LLGLQTPAIGESNQHIIENESWHSGPKWPFKAIQCEHGGHSNANNVRQNAETTNQWIQEHCKNKGEEIDNEKCQLENESEKGKWTQFKVKDSVMIRR